MFNSLKRYTTRKYIKYQFNKKDVYVTKTFIEKINKEYDSFNDYNEKLKDLEEEIKFYLKKS